MIRTVSMGEGEPGLRPLVAALEEEGFDDVGAGQLVESFARHLMVAHRRLAGARFRRGRAQTICERAAAARKACAATSTRTAICSSGAWARSRSSGAARCRARPAGLARSDRPEGRDVKLLRTIRLDPSDTFVFERAAEPGEWAVSGAFVFWTTTSPQLAGKARAAFRGGFLGVGSLGWSTLVQIVEASEDDRAAVVDTLAQQLVATFRCARYRGGASRRRRKRSHSRPRSAIIRRTR